MTHERGGTGLGDGCRQSGVAETREYAGQQKDMGGVKSDEMVAQHVGGFLSGGGICHARERGEGGLVG